MSVELCLRSATPGILHLYFEYIRNLEVKVEYFYCDNKNHAGIIAKIQFIFCKYKDTKINFKKKHQVCNSECILYTTLSTFFVLNCIY